MRRDGTLGGVILVALTGDGRDDDRSLARAAGFDHHLVKPVDPDRLETLIASFAGASERRETAR